MLCYVWSFLESKEQDTNFYLWDWRILGESLENENECYLSDVMFEIFLNQKNKILTFTYEIDGFLVNTISWKMNVIVPMLCL